MSATKEKDSRSETVEPEPSIYITSEPLDNNWGQPSASKYVFWVEGGKLRGTLISGIYISQPTSEEIYTSLTIAEETEAWDILSDEALFNFEAELD